MSADLVDRAKQVDIRDVAGRYTTLKRATSIECVGPCPFCGGRDRFGVNTRKQVWNCRGCDQGGDVVALVQHVEGLSFREAVERLSGEHAEPSRVKPLLRPQGATQKPTTTRGALQMWRECVDPRQTVVKAYLKARGLELPDEIAGEALRYHPGEGTMIALFRDVLTDEPKAISRTFIDRETLKRLERKFLGPVGGCAVKLDTDEKVLGGLHIGEGIETCLAARQLGLRPTWALGSKGAIGSFPLLAGIESLTILAEPDAEKEIEVVAMRWHAAGREVLINRPPVGKDLNDALKGSAA
jgi:hypothetical protein